MGKLSNDASYPLATLLDIPSPDLIPLSPQKYPGCCLFISQSLIETLRANLPCPPHLVLSIGSGNGFLEALLLDQSRPSRSPIIECVEVASLRATRKHVPEEVMHYVDGTRHLHQRAADATAWIFVYPRDPQLPIRYMKEYGSSRVETIHWLGPKADWQDFEKLVRNLGDATFSPPTVEDGFLISEWEVYGTVSKHAESIALSKVIDSL
ncbi:hypothetical protein K402DRAFT_398452 [Aulographum hederae CBS 113979]|uniref:Uncharacterized protein n=1 Tax=Aulographum hederae CBS 113979 TaxID=1176131 RepID=A0A6G1GKX3_9PEZI|nr:hypothetical protein K402DRAFT_398452 [Aulographum hederae CBS 113979]